MILAAGRGERMRPLTDATPKPLLMAGGKRLIEWQIERLVAAGMQRIVINHAWLGDQFEATLGAGSRYGCALLYSAETQALETAGGIAQALPLLGDAPFIVVSGDIYTDFDYRSLPALSADAAAHLVLVPNPEYNPRGDMALVDGKSLGQVLGQVLENPPAGTPKLTYGNIGVLSPEPFRSIAPHSKLKLFPWLYAQGAISGECFGGAWHNVGTPAQLAALNAALSTA